VRRLVVSTFVTLDGVVEAPHRWSFDFQSPDTLRRAVDVLFAADALLLGRRTYEAFAAAWPSRRDDHGFADRMNALPKHVVSTTLRRPRWNNSHVIDEDVVERVRRLKADRDLLMYGSPTLMRSLLPHDLIDELLLLLNPVVIGGGARLFPEGVPPQALATQDATALGGGMTLLRLRPTGTVAAD
jgi:dihydrofolate reductase